MDETTIKIDIINRISELNNKIIVTENNLKISKYEYHQELLELKYSLEYDKFKTIKEKEERAKLENAPLELDILDFEKQLQELKLEKEVLMLKLKYLYTPFVEFNRNKVQE